MSALQWTLDQVAHFIMGVIYCHCSIIIKLADILGST